VKRKDWNLFFERLNQGFVGDQVRTSTTLKGLASNDNEQKTPDAPGFDWPKKHAKRNLVNTYVWSADLGFFAEENQTMDVREESMGASFSRSVRGGIEGQVKLLNNAGIGAFASASTKIGSDLNVDIAKSETSSDAFSMHVTVAADDLLNKWMGASPDSGLTEAQQLDLDGFSAQAAPGKVQSYRFMSFYLAPHEKNWSDFFGKVVDPGWLHNSNNPDARALRVARPQKNGVWKVMHRVTFINRVPPSSLDAPIEDKEDPANVPDNVEDNSIIIDLVKNALSEMAKTQDVDVNRPTRANIGDAVYVVLGSKEAGSTTQIAGSIVKIYPWWRKYWQAGELTTQQQAIRKNITEYMLKYYKAVSLSTVVV
jgi:hypothetical protein